MNKKILLVSILLTALLLPTLSYSTEIKEYPQYTPLYLTNNNLLNTLSEINKTSDVPISVIIVSKNQPIYQVSKEVEEKYSTEINDYISQAREIYKNKPKLSEEEVRNKNLSEVIKYEYSFYTDEEKAQLREIGERIDANKDQMKKEIDNQLKLLLEGEQNNIKNIIIDCNGNISGSTFIINSIFATVPYSCLFNFSQRDDVLAVYEKTGPLTPHLDISVPTTGATTWHSNGYDGGVWDIAIVDTGIDDSHPNLIVDQAAVFHTAAQNDFFYDDDPVDPDDFVGHGTHMAGITMSGNPTYRGIAYGADQLINAKAAYKRLLLPPQMEWPDAYSAIDWSIVTAGADVVSFSVGENPNSAYNENDEFVDAVIDYFDVMIAVSAGNSGPSGSTIESPGNAYNIISVGASDDHNTVGRADDNVADFSSRGPTFDGRIKPDLIVPGTNIWSTNNNWETENDFIEGSGTSPAAPHVAGSVLLILDYKGIRWDPRAIKALLINTADNGGAFSSSNDAGWGYMDLNHAFSHRDDVFVNNIIEGDYKFYKGPVAIGDKATLVWNKHNEYITGQEPSTAYPLNDLDVYFFKETDNTLQDQSLSSINNIEQVQATTNFNSVVKVNAYTTDFTHPSNYEDFALATEEGFTAVDSPTLTANLIAVSSVTIGSIFTVDATVTNNGGIRAHNVDVQLNVPSGLSIISGSNPQSLGAIDAGITETAPWTIQASSCGSYLISTDVDSYSYGETFITSDTHSIQVTCDVYDGCYSGTFRDYYCSSGACSYTEKITDNDGDGYDTECDGDCVDTNPNIHPGADDSNCNNVDEDCDGIKDDNYVSVSCGSGNCIGTSSCVSGNLQCSSTGTDCGTCCICSPNPNPSENYDATQDADCSATTCPADGCGIGGCGTNIFGDFPFSTPNYCSAIYSCTANSCTVNCEIDSDLDTYSSSCGDCDDTDSTRYSGAPELCDGKDNDCDIIIPINEADNDLDGYRICENDCDDANANVNPSTTEICNWIDDNCDGQIDETCFPDLDLTVSRNLSTFNDSSIEKDLIFDSSGDQTVWIKIPKNSTIDSAYMSLTGYEKRWVADDARVMGLPDIGWDSAPSMVFNLKNDNKWVLINGNSDGVFSGYSWNGTYWIQDTSMINGLPDVGGNSTPDIEFNVVGNNKWMLASGTMEGWVKRFFWDGSSWYDGYAHPDIGIDTSPDMIFNLIDDNRWTMIVGDEMYAFKGFYWNGIDWIENSSLVVGLPGTNGGYAARPEIVFNLTGDNRWTMIFGNYWGVFQGYYWGGAQWIEDVNLVRGLPNLGRRTAPEIKFDVMGDKRWTLISGKQDGNFNGFYWINDIIQNPNMDTGADAIIDWSFNGTYETKTKIDLNASAMNNYLLTCIADNDGSCDVPINIHSDSAGKLTLSEIEINYNLDIDIITFNPQNPIEDDIVTITAKIYNRGWLPADNFKVELLIDDMSQSNNTISVLPHSYTETQFNWKAMANGHTIIIKADPDNIIQEIKEDNNEAEKSISVQRIPKADITIAKSGLLTTLNDTSTEKNLTFKENGNKTVFITLPKDSIVLDAKLNLRGGFSIWERMHNAPEPFWKGASIISDGIYIYVLTGNSGAYGDIGEDFYKYNIATDSWVQLAGKPEGTTYGSDMEFDGTHIYAITGAGYSGLYRYNISSNQWNTMTGMPVPFEYYGSDLTYANDYLYALRGGSREFYRYDINNNIWNNMTLVPEQIGRSGSLAFDGEYIYALRGDSNNFYRYNISNNSWDNVRSVPQSVFVGSDIQYDNSTSVYAIRGYTNGKKDFYRYDIIKDIWYNTTPLVEKPYWGTDMIFKDGYAYVVRLSDTGFYEPYFYRYLPEVTNTYLQIENYNYNIFSYDGDFVTENRTSDFSADINSYLQTCVADGNENCDIPLLVHSDTGGVIEVSNIEIKYIEPEIIISPSDPTEGALVTINATIYNIGELDANNAKIEFLVDDISQANNTISVLADSESQTLFAWDSIGGDHIITIKADPDNDINEHIETDNNLSKPIYVTCLNITVPDPITGLTSKLEDNLQDVTLVWTSPSNMTGIAHYRIYRSTALNGTYTFIHDTISDANPLQSSWTDIGSALTIDNYFYKVRTATVCNNEGINDDLVAAKFIVPIVRDFNLVSTPLVQYNESIYEVLKSTDWNYTLYYDAFDPSNLWKTNYIYRADILDDLFYLNHKMGYWVGSESDSAFITTGAVPISTSIALKNYSWNMIGFPWFMYNYTVGDFKAANPKVDIIEGFDLPAEYNTRVLNDSELMLPGNAYWIHLNADPEWTTVNIESKIKFNSSDITLTPDKPAIGDATAINAEIHNIGEAVSPPVNAIFYIDGNLIGAVPVQRISALSSEIAKKQWSAMSGEHTIHIIIDYNTDPKDGYITEGYRTITIGNYPPVPIIDYYQKTNITLRVEGRKDNSVTLKLLGNNTTLNEITVMRTAGQPNEKTFEFNKYDNMNYTAVLIYNATHNGANPTEVAIQSEQATQSIRKTFNTNEGFYQEYAFDVNEILNTILSQSRTYYFNASGSYDTDGYIISYLWDFDDGLNSTQIFEKHKFQDRGIYFVTLAIKDNEEASRTAGTSINIMNATMPFRRPHRPEHIRH